MYYFANPSRSVASAMTAGIFGAILTPAQGTALPAGARWCADNGCFGGSFPGEPAWFNWLTALPYPRGVCEFAVAPDVVGDAEATLVRSTPWLPQIRDLGYRAAFVAQDGLTPSAVPWAEFDVLFIGGTDAFKLGPDARLLIREAVGRQVPVHMGRVNTRGRLRYAAALGCSTADGTMFTFGPEANMTKMTRWLHEIHQTRPVTAHDLHPPIPSNNPRPRRAGAKLVGKW